MRKVAIEHADNYRLETIKDTLIKCFKDIGYPQNNPLQYVVHPGDKVFIKPNWVASRWRASCSHTDTLYSVITHPNIIEVVADFVAEALQGDGEIVIGDNPSIDADFNELMEFTKIKTIQNKYNVPVSILDLRPLICDNLKYYGKKAFMVQQKGDPCGSVEINLGKDSLLYGLDSSRFRGVFDERDETIESHIGEKQLYSFSRSLYESDVYISIPKLKTHQKVGATLNLKGLVGTVSNKNQLVHWQIGYPEIGGDEYPNREAFLVGQTATIKHRGAWPGNDTIWRMVCDLYKAFKIKRRNYFSVVDGIVAGEGQGPFCPTSKNANTIIVGEDLLATDCVAVRYMGLNPEKIKYLRYFLKEHYDDICINNIEVWNNGMNVRHFFQNHTNYADFFVLDQWNELKYL